MTGDDCFDDLWAEYVEMDRDISDTLGLEPITDGDDDRKERARELWEDGNLSFVGNVPVVTPTGAGE